MRSFQPTIPHAKILAMPLIALVFSSPALAQQNRTASELSRGNDDDFHNRQIDEAGEIVVTAIGVNELDVLTGSAVVEGIDLQRRMDGQIGEVLADLPGVSATSFSPGASRPVLRGFSGERVRVLVDGIGTIDVSNTSADHATTIDPLTAERIEVLRGPAVLLYGSQAIGGAVNVVDKRIPQRMLGKKVHIDALIGTDTAYDLREGAGSLDVRMGDSFVFHIDGAYRKTNDVEIAGFALAPELMADVLADADEEEEEGELEEAEELRELANQSNVLPDSNTETFSANAGFAFFRDGGNLGAAFGIYDTRYGVPTRPGTGHHHEEEEGDEDHEDGDEDHEGEEEGEESIAIDLRQYRADLRGKLPLGGFFSALHTRVGYSNYTHTEFEGDEVGTVFDVQGIEARALLEQSGQGGWRGSLGAQYYYRDFDAFGAEAYVPPNQTEQISFFALQEIAFEPFQLEFAGRYEGSSVESQQAGFDRSFDSFSGAVSFAWQNDDGLRAGISASRVERAPSAEELLSDGPHIATQAFEIGNPALAQESAWGVEGFVRGRLGRATVNFAIFQNWFDNYIYLQPTGDEEDELPVFAYRQDDADYFGIEGEVTIPLIENHPFTLLADFRGDYIRASLSDGTPLPLIPPLRLQGALEAQTEQFDGRLEVQWSDKQGRVAPLETTTDSFTYVNASLAWKPLGDDGSVTVMLAANNIFDQTGRRHASITKDFVPLAGRNFKLSLRASF